jgi:hypothetical protein
MINSPPLTRASWWQRCLGGPWRGTDQSTHSAVGGTLERATETMVAMAGWQAAEVTPGGTVLREPVVGRGTRPTAAWAGGRRTWRILDERCLVSPYVEVGRWSVGAAGAGRRGPSRSRRMTPASAGCPLRSASPRLGRPGVRRSISAHGRSRCIPATASYRRCPCRTVCVLGLSGRWWIVGRGR